MGRFGIMLLFVFLTSKSPAQAPNSSPEQLVRKVVTNELRADNQDHSHWMFRLDTEKPNTPEEVDEVVETENGDLKYPILISGRKLTEAERGQADQRMLQEMQNPSILRKSLHDKTQDNARGQNILKLLPNTFLFQYGERKRNLVELKFRPNPQFQPPTHEARFSIDSSAIYIIILSANVLFLAQVAFRHVLFLSPSMGVLPCD